MKREVDRKEFQKVVINLIAHMYVMDFYNIVTIIIVFHTSHDGVSGIIKYLTSKSQKAIGVIYYFGRLEVVLS